MNHKPDSRPPLERERPCRYRAEELRTTAGEWMDSGTRQVLTRVAKDYEDIAQRLERQDPNAKIPPGWLSEHRSGPAVSPDRALTTVIQAPNIGRQRSVRGIK